MVVIMISEEKTKLNGGPAFPFGQMSELTGQPINGYHNDGMSLRDYFAGQALAAMELDKERRIHGGDFEYSSADTVARRCYDYADAMIRYSNKEM